MANHGGFFFTYQSLVTVLPDVGIAVYSQITGENGNELGNYMYRVNTFVLDTLLEIEQSMQTKPNIPPASAASLWISENPLPDLNEYSTDMLSQKSSGPEYAGTYGNFAMGNMTISYDNETDTLFGTYGIHGNLLLEEITPNIFLGTALEPYWFAPPLLVVFGSSDGETWDSINIPFFFPQHPEAMTFVRNRMIADAPEPDDEDCSDFN